MTQVAEQPHPLVGGGQVVQHGLEQVQGEAHGQVAGITQDEKHEQVHLWIVLLQGNQNSKPSMCHMITTGRSKTK